MYISVFCRLTGSNPINELIARRTITHPIVYTILLAVFRIAREASWLPSFVPLNFDIHCFRWEGTELPCDNTLLTSECIACNVRVKCGHYAAMAGVLESTSVALSL